MFTQPCFIRKNTTELRKRLERLGYKPNSYECFWDDETRYIITTIDGNGFAYYTLCIQNSCLLKNKMFIDCETHEELFIALAALRDDSDYMQWFTYNNYWHKCLGNNFSKYAADWILFPDADVWHKATIEEIMEHFKNK